MNSFLLFVWKLRVRTVWHISSQKWKIIKYRLEPKVVSDTNQGDILSLSNNVSMIIDNYLYIISESLRLMQNILVVYMQIMSLQIIAMVYKIFCRWDRILCDDGLSTWIPMEWKGRHIRLIGSEKGCFCTLHIKGGW